MSSYYHHPYSDSAALIDVGFVLGYFEAEFFYQRLSNQGEALWHLTEQIEDLVTKGRLHDGQSDDEARKMLLFSLGELLGRTWHAPIPGAVSSALDRVMEHYTQHTPMHKVDADSSAQRGPLDDRLSNEQRNRLFDVAETGGETFSPEFAEGIGATFAGVVAFWNEVGAIDGEEARELIDGAKLPTPQRKNEGQSSPIEGNTERGSKPDALSPSLAPNIETSPPSPGSAGGKEWTPEKRAEAAERTRQHSMAKPPLVPDDDFESVKTEWESGVSPERIGKRYGCSGGTIRNFLSKHGVDPRRGAPGVKTGGRPGLTEAEKTLIIEEKAKSTPSAEIGKMIDRSQHAVDVKYSQLKKDGLVPEAHLAPEAIAARKERQNELVSERMKAFYASKQEVVLQSEPEAVQNPAIPAEEPQKPAESWDFDALTAADWPDIQKMLVDGRPREVIASDYDVPLNELNTFIDAQLKLTKERRDAKAGSSGGV